MNPVLQRLVTAYRPLGQRGLLMDGQYCWDAANASNDRQESTPVARPRRRMLLAALTGPYHGNFFKRSKS